MHGLLPGALAILAIIAGIPLSACPMNNASTAPDFRVQGELAWDGVVLTYVSESAAHVPVDAGHPLPYQVVTLGEPVLVTVLSSQLVPTTYALARDTQVYPGMIPLLADPPLMALGTLLPDEPLSLSAVTLLNSTGEEVFSIDDGALLLPVVASQDTVECYLVQAGGADMLHLFGPEALLLAVTPADGNARWAVELSAGPPLVDVELWALSSQWGLLCLQYGYDLYELVRFNRATGALGPRWPLAGQPAYTVVYPGQFYEPAELTLDGDVAQCLVDTVEHGWQNWRIDLEQGQLDTVSAAPPSSIRREENELPVGGASIPGPPHPPFPQRLLPAAACDRFKIPALIKDGTSVLVVDAAGARWVALTSQ